MNAIDILYTDEPYCGYPVHSHDHWEIILYIAGEGDFFYGDTSLPICQGTAVLIPPGIVHSNTARKNFRNISLQGDFSHLLMFHEPKAVQCEPESRVLADLLWKNRYAGQEYVMALTSAFLYSLLQSVKYDGQVLQAIKYITETMHSHFADPNLQLRPLLEQTGYAPDYLRARFREITGMTPVRYLARVRIDHGRNLLGTYGSSITVAEAARACGFEDPVYFSRRFRQLVGCSPEQYRNARKR